MSGSQMCSDGTWLKREGSQLATSVSSAKSYLRIIQWPLHTLRDPIWIYDLAIRVPTRYLLSESDPLSSVNENKEKREKLMKIMTQRKQTLWVLNDRRWKFVVLQLFLHLFSPLTSWITNCNFCHTSTKNRELQYIKSLKIYVTFYCTVFLPSKSKAINSTLFTSFCY